MILDAEIEGSLCRFDLLPRNWNQNRIEMHLSKPRKNTVCLRRSASRGVAQFSAENQIWLAMDE
jgi:hypothetical protein